MAAALTVCVSATAQAQTTTGSTETGSTGCAALTQASANAINNRIQANDSYLTQPASVGGLSCLDNFFKGEGLNLITNGLDPAALLSSVAGQVETQICQAAQSAWTDATGQVQCGLSVTGVNLGLGFSGGSGVMCPSLSFGGGGPTIASASASTGGAAGGNSLYINGSPTLPTGYTANAVSAIEGVF